MIYVIATISVDPDRRTDFLQAFAELTPTVLAEEGCLEYQAAIDQPTNIEAQTQAGDGVVVVVEKWDSVSALEAHLAAPHMAAFREANAAIVRDVSLQILQPHA